jgi:tetratricopeptide (TPR) repeat protein
VTRGHAAGRRSRTPESSRAVSRPSQTVPLAHPAWILAALVAAVCIALSVSFEIHDPDPWQHLAVGRAIWTLHAIPHVHLWTWPSWGSPEVLPSWGFCALVWPIEAKFGVLGLFVWRWATTLAAFGIVWAAARRMGARGFAPLVVLVLCSLIYRQRSQIRPETLVIVLIAAELWILEVRRTGGPDRTWWIVPLVMLWINLHLSYVLAFLILGCYAAHDLATRGSRPPPWRLFAVAAASGAALFVNPFGVHAVWEPVQFLLHGRDEAIYRGIVELMPWDWRRNPTEGVHLVLLGWPLLMIARTRKRGLDLAEILLCVSFTAMSLSARRFLGFYAIVAAPFVARDVDEWLRTRSLPGALRLPAARAAVACACCVVIGLPEWSRADRPLGIAWDATGYPVEACDFMAAHGIGGRGFNHFHFGGYLLWRFWPDRTRLPFMDIHQSGSVRDRWLYQASLASRRAWNELDAERRFDYALLDRKLAHDEQLVDFLDEDSAWSLVFADDDAVVFVRRTPALAAVADSFGYHVWPAGPRRLAAAIDRLSLDAAFRHQAQADLERQARTSSRASMADFLLARVALIEGRLADSRVELGRAITIAPRIPEAHRELGGIALAEGNATHALREYRIERHEFPAEAGVDFLIGVANQHLARWRAARAAFRREIAHHPDTGEARDSLAAVETRLAR